MLHRTPKDDNFIEKRRVWRSRLDQKIGPGLLVTVLPAIVMCLFLVLAAPFLKRLGDEFFGLHEDDVSIRKIETSQESAPVEEEGPPPNPELAIARIYQRQFDQEGFDWRSEPQLEEPEVQRVENPIEIKPVSVEIPLPMIELKKSVSTNPE